MIRMKKIVTTLIVILSVGVMVLNACSSREAIAVPIDIANRLMTEVDMPKGVLVTDENAKDTSQLAAALMGEEFTPDIFEAYAFYPPMLSVNASEFGILKVKDNADVDKVKEIIRNRIDNTMQTFDGYLPDQYDIAKNAEIRTDGRYVYYSMTKNNDRVFDIIDEMLNDK